MNPDCRDGKHKACSGDGWDLERDERFAPTVPPKAANLAAQYGRRVGA